MVQRTLRILRSNCIIGLRISPVKTVDERRKIIIPTLFIPVLTIPLLGGDAYVDTPSVLTVDEK
jgi:hypothetical protein